MFPQLAINYKIQGKENLILKLRKNSLQSGVDSQKCPFLAQTAAV